MQLIGAGLRDHADLPAGALAVFGRIGIAEYIELPDGVNAQQLAADSSRRDTDVAAPRVFNPVQQEKIVRRPPAGHSEIGAFPGAYRRSRLEVVEDGPRIESNQVVETAAVERQIFDFSFPDQSRNRCRS